MSLEAMADAFVTRKSRSQLHAMTLRAEHPTSVVSVKGAVAVTQTGQTVTSDNKVSSFLTQLTKYIPTEVIGAYLAAVAAIPTPTWVTNPDAAETGASTQSDGWLLAVFLAGTVLSPILVWLLARAKDNALKVNSGPPYFGMAAAVLAFATWAIYLPNSVVAHDWHIPTYGAAIIAIFTTLALYTIDLWLDAKATTLPGLGAGGIALPEQSPNIVHTPRTSIDTADNSSTGLSDGPVNAHAGVVMASARISTVFVGQTFWATEGQTRDVIDNFVDAFVRDATVGKTLRDYGIATLTRGEKLLTSEDFPTNLVDSDIQTIVQNLVDGGRVRNTQDALLVCFLPSGTTVDAGATTGSLEVVPQSIAGYHWYIGGIVYGVVGYLADNPALLDSQTIANALTAATSHEICEAVSDPYPNPDDSSTWGWFDESGNEIADKCVSQYATVVASDGTKFIRQKIYANSTGSCT